MRKIVLIAVVVTVLLATAAGQIRIIENHGVEVDENLNLVVRGGKYAVFPLAQNVDSIKFEVMLNEGGFVDFYFFINEKGTGQMLRLDSRNYPSGFDPTTSFKKWRYMPEPGPHNLEPGIFHKVTIWFRQNTGYGITSTVAYARIDNETVKPMVIKKRGNWAAIHGDHWKSPGGKFRNIRFFVSTPDTSTPPSNTSAVLDTSAAPTPAQADSISKSPPQVQQTVQQTMLEGKFEAEIEIASTEEGVILIKIKEIKPVKSSKVK